jgi:hypothetical protein
MVHDQIPLNVKDLDPLTIIQAGFIWMLKNRFGERRQGDFRWDSDERTTEIVIGADRLQTSGLGARPGIVVMPMSNQSTNLSMDQLLDKDSPTSDRSHMDLESMTMAIMCVTKNIIEARRVGWSARSYIRNGKRVLQRTFGIHAISEPIRMEPPSDPSKYLMGDITTEWVGISIYVPVFFCESWVSRTIDVIVLKKMDVNIEYGGNVVVNQLNTVRPPNAYGLPLKKRFVQVST